MARRRCVPGLAKWAKFAGGNYEYRFRSGNHYQIDAGEGLRGERRYQLRFVDVVGAKAGKPLHNWVDSSGFALDLYMPSRVGFRSPQAAVAAANKHCGARALVSPGGPGHLGACRR